METNALDYTLAVFLFIVNKNKVYLVVFHSYTFTAVELNYNIYDKELLAIFKAFKIWQYYWPILSTLLWIIKTLSNFLLLRYWPRDKYGGLSIFLSSTLLSGSVCYDWYFLNTAWTWAKGNDNMIDCATSISVSTSCSRYNILTLALWTMTRFPHILWMLFLWNILIYSIDTALYSLCFTNWYLSHSFLKYLPKLQPKPSIRL